MAGTLTPDREFQRFNRAKENVGNYFRFKPRSILFNIFAMGIVPFGIFYYGYSHDGKDGFYRRFRQQPVLNQEYVPRKKDL